ncbi:BadF/BadG/BcrA/BcrD ATPase family protein [Pseudoxanthomonas sp. PXM01]|uniref:BadF/BadG/BcrA/BcrD ATPase family protein n=1 Tax=Pseudoxanthomonas sp. PXM01 TaxID=2769295 RepID=UPI001784A6D5|nr:BadF/BadG/BcrA/BcrD ATPase family protein [Pseudoxanthomonas sp. PXM01]MBD9471043.1 N-acetylglucosamine kinase [Pseudoxanthomonas sp. PXM01]
MTGSLYLGVDGGGTKTRFALMDDDGQLVAQAQTGTTYHPEVGFDGVQQILSDGIATVLGQVAVADAGAIAYAFFGLPAHGEDTHATARLDAIPAQILGHDRYRCDNDMVCGWAGSLACGDGINIVAGTGSIGYGQRQGVDARGGGWGETFSDEGSAYWIAVQGLNAYSRMSDGRLPKGPLHALVNERLELASDLDLCARIYGPGVGTRAEIAQISRIVADAARQADGAALDIYARAGQELADIVLAIRQRLAFDSEERIAVSYSGGAFSAGDLLMAPFAAALQAASPQFTLQTPLHEPHYGAALYARLLAHRTVLAA